MLVRVGVGVDEGLPVGVSVPVAVRVGEGVLVGVEVGVLVGVAVPEGVGVPVGIGVPVGVEVSVGVALGTKGRSFTISGKKTWPTQPSAGLLPSAVCTARTLDTSTNTMTRQNTIRDRGGFILEV